MAGLVATNAISFDKEANFTENLDYVGQAGGYASRGFAQLGKKTAFIGYVGDDFEGRFIGAEFSRDQIDMSAVFIDPTGTSRSINFMYPDGRRKNFYDGKAHMTLHPDLDLCRRVLAATRLVHFNIPNWARDLLPLARALGLTISCDIQDVVHVDDDYRSGFIRYADILFFSAVNFPDPAPLIARFLEINTACVVISGMGAQGCMVGKGDTIRHFPATSGDSPVIDTNGAGDGLATGFLSSFVLDGFSLEDSILRGQITARHTCAQKASSSSLITRAALDEQFKRHLAR